MLGGPTCHTLVCVCAHTWVIARSPVRRTPIGTHVVRDRRVPPHLVSRLATTSDDIGEQARSVNLLGSCTRGGVNGATRWLTVNIHRWVAKLTVDKTVGSSLTVLGSCRETGVPHWGAWDR